MDKIKSVTIRMRVTASDAKQWRAAAGRERRTLSDWMRLRLREAAQLPVKRH